MNLLGYLASSVLETLIRFLPIPCRTGLVKIGDPEKDSPVFLTCNYHLTVQRIKRALRGKDTYLLIANSRGINVWCASIGGHFTNHDVISVLKTSGIEDLVSRREVILPQLAAAGIEAKVVEERTGWSVVWGPVYAKDIPRFLKAGQKKSPEMGEVGFPWTHRLEMAIAWSFPISLLLSLILIFFWSEGILPAVVLTWGLSLLIFISFPVYRTLLQTKREKPESILLGFVKMGFPLIIWSIIFLGLVKHGILFAPFNWGLIIRLCLLALVVIFILSVDLKGSTPIYKSGLHAERLYKVILDRRRCREARSCEDVCPRNCFRVDKKEKKASMPGAGRCIVCGACVIQCPHDALRFRSPEGEEIFPDRIRKSKLGLLGKRIKRV